MFSASSRTPKPGLLLARGSRLFWIGGTAVLLTTLRQTLRLPQADSHLSCSPAPSSASLAAPCQNLDRLIPARSSATRPIFTSQSHVPGNTRHHVGFAELRLYRFARTSNVGAKFRCSDLCKVEMSVVVVQCVMWEEWDSFLVPHFPSGRHFHRFSFSLPLFDIRSSHCWSPPSEHTSGPGEP
jgi:hypothetical protein